MGLEVIRRDYGHDLMLTGGITCRIIRGFKVKREGLQVGLDINRRNY